MLIRSVISDSLWWTVACQAPLSMGILQQEYWSGLLCPPPEDLPNPRIKPRSPTVQADSLSHEPPGKPMNIGVSSLSLLQGIFPTKNQTIVGGFFTNWATREAKDLKHGSKSLRNNFCSFNWSTSYQSYWFIWVFSSWKKSCKWMPGISQRNECIRLNL